MKQQQNNTSALRDHAASNLRAQGIDGMMQRSLAVLLLMLLPLCGMAQHHRFATGSLQDDEGYAQVPAKATMLTRNYSNLPPRASLQPYCPTPRDQGSYSTCCSWAVAYAARTIMEATVDGRTNSDENARDAFSPTFVYTKIKSPDDSECEGGSRLSDAMKLLKNMGVPKMSTFYTTCSESIPMSAVLEAPSFRIKDYFRLFTPNAPAEKKIETTKMALAQERPVVISMECYASFEESGAVWNGRDDEFLGQHAMCVVGYDDELYGGAFRIMNSWGTSWADGGFVWVTYDDYARRVHYGYEMYLDEALSGKSRAKLSGSLEIKLSTGGVMPVSLVDGSYRVSRSYTSGTRYRVYLSNHEPAYVYVIGSDMTRADTILFPPTPDISPALVYSANDIAIPDERYYIATDNTEGTDYLCLLYSRSAIDIDRFMKRLSASSGSFSERVGNALGNMGVAAKDITFDPAQVKFSTRASEAVLPIIVEIPHSR